MSYHIMQCASLSRRLSLLLLLPLSLSLMCTCTYLWCGSTCSLPDRGSRVDDGCTLKGRGGGGGGGREEGEGETHILFLHSNTHSILFSHSQRSRQLVFLYSTIYSSPSHTVIISENTITPHTSSTDLLSFPNQISSL